MKVLLSGIAFVCFYGFLVSADNGSIAPQSEFQKFQVKRTHKIKITNEEMAQAARASKEAFENSSPEVQAAILKAANEKCPSKILCPEYKENLSKCEKNRKSKNCDDFIEIFKKLSSKYDCQRSFDKNPVPAIWLCDEATDGYPKPHEKGIVLLAKLKTKNARKFFSSDEFRSTLDGELAEEYLDLSYKAAGRAN